MVVIFVLLIFTFSQFILSYILSGQSRELDSLHVRIAEISELLGLEVNRNKEMSRQIASLTTQVGMLTLDRSIIPLIREILNKPIARIDVSTSSSRRADRTDSCDYFYS
jgi:hypothetical protein